MSWISLSKQLSIWAYFTFYVRLRGCANKNRKCIALVPKHHENAAKISVLFFRTAGANAALKYFGLVTENLNLAHSSAGGIQGERENSEELFNLK